MSTQGMCASYVYALLDPRYEGHFRFGRFVFKHMPFYIGKGTGKRAESHLSPSATNYNTRKTKIIKSIRRTKLEPVISIKKTGLSSSEALSLERSLVLKIGRLNLKTGPLTNLNDGGIGGPSGYIRTKEQRENISNLYWAKTEAERKEISNKRSKTFCSKSKSELEELRKNLRQGHAEMDKKAKTKFAKTMFHKTKSYWASMTDEQRKERARKISEAHCKMWAEFSENEKRVRIQAIRTSTESYHSGLSDREIRKRSERNRNAALTRYL